MLYMCFVTDCQRRRFFGFEFVMLANHDKKMTKTKSHWFRMVYIEVQDKKLKFGMKKMSYKLFHSIGTQSIENRISAKISKRKKPIT